MTFRAALLVVFATASGPLSGCGSSSPESSDGAAGAPADLPADTTTQPPAAPPAATDAPTAPAPDIDPNALPSITPGEGITVESVERVSARTFDIMVSTPNVAANVKMRKGNGIRITLPPNYAASGKRYPVLYFLHGATCDFTTISEAIPIEDKMASAENEAIVVMPEGGLWGLYTDWVDPSPTQKWLTYQLTQLIPFIDRNLRTLGAKEGRAVVGFSMGGLGAMRWAFERPDLFAAAASFSGVVDLYHSAFQAGLLAGLQEAGLNPAGPFGDLFSPVWGETSPSQHAAKLATVETFIYVGKGNDPVELVTTQSGYVLDKALTDAKISHFFKNYGAPGATPEGNCNGEHSLACARYAFADALPRVMAVLADPK